MKLCFALLLVHVFSSVSYSQSGWIQQNSGISTKLHSIYFVNSLTGWCCGDYGKISKTTNGGTSWFLLNTGTTKNLKSLSFPSSNVAFVVGDSGTNLKTTDGGNSWTILNIPNRNCNFRCVFFINDSLGFVGGKFFDIDFVNKIYKTTNGGNSWDSLASEQSDYVNSIYFINPTLGWKTGGYKLGGNESISKTNNAGLNWINQYFGNPPFNTVFFIDSLNGWAAGKRDLLIPAILKTTNGGNNWIVVSPALVRNVYSINFIDRYKGWAAAENKSLYYSSNGGTNWIQQTPTQPGFVYRSIFFIDSLTGWAAGDSGVILKTTTGGIVTNFSNYESEILDKFLLSQNYPNPFNPTTHLEFGISNLGFVSLKVYDVLGNEVAILVNEKKTPGNYEVEFEGSDLPSGIYFCTLSVDGNIVDTKRMVLLK